MPEILPSPTTFNPARVMAILELARRSVMSRPEFVSLLRGETPEDPRPNKSLIELPLPPSSPMPFIAERWSLAVRHGERPQWAADKPRIQTSRPRNHTSVDDHIDKVRQHILKGEHDGRYLILEERMLEHWSELFISPLGVVDKQSPDGHDIRVINDYSGPNGSSVDSYTICDDFPPISYNPRTDIARRIRS